MAESTDMQNLGKFLKYIEFAEEDSEWQPTNLLLDVATMRKQHAACLSLVEEVFEKIAPNRMAINEREIAYNLIFPKKINRTLKFYKSNNPSAQAIADAETLQRKATGSRKKPKAVDDPNTTANEAEANYSASQQSYESLLGHFRALNALYAADAKYQTNEPGFAVAELTADADELEAKNAKVAETAAPLSTARINRENSLYLNDNSMFAVQQAYKNYSAARYGTSDPRHKRITALQIKKPRRLR